MTTTILFLRVETFGGAYTNMITWQTGNHKTKHRNMTWPRQEQIVTHL